MKNYLYLSALSLFLSSLLFGQIDQGTFHRGMSNTYTDVSLYPDSSFILAESIQENGQRRAALTAKSPYGMDSWKVITEEEIEILMFQDLIPIDDNTFGVLGYRQDCCDCSDAIPFYQIRSLEDGSLLDEIVEIIPEGLINNAFIDEDDEFDAVLTDWGFVVSNFNAVEKTVFNFDLQGNLLNTYTLPGGGNRVAGFQGDFVMEQQNVVYRFDQMGLALDSIVYNDDVTQITSSDNALAIIQDDVLRFYNSDFEVSDSLNITGIDAAVFGYDTGFHLFTPNTFYRFNEAGEIEMTYSFSLHEGLNIRDIKVQEDFFIFAGSERMVLPFVFSFHVHQHAAWQMHGVGGPAPLWHIDLGLTDISIDNIEIVDQIGNTQYEATVTVTVGNEGTFPVSDFYLNNLKGNGICFDFYENHFHDLAIPNQDEVEITLENITGIGLPLIGDSVALNICIFLTSPLGGVDSDNSDDLICVNEVFFLSTDDIDLSQYVNVYPNPARDFIQIDSELRYTELRLINALGQTVEAFIPQNQNRIEVSHLEPGLYLLQLETERGWVTKKVVIEN